MKTLYPPTQLCLASINSIKYSPYEEPLNVQYIQYAAHTEIGGYVFQWMKNPSYIIYTKSIEEGRDFIIDQIMREEKEERERMKRLRESFNAMAKEVISECSIAHLLEGLAREKDKLS